MEDMLDMLECNYIEQSIILVWSVPSSECGLCPHTGSQNWETGPSRANTGLLFNGDENIKEMF